MPITPIRPTPAGIAGLPETRLTTPADFAVSLAKPEVLCEHCITREVELRARNARNLLRYRLRVAAQSQAFWPAVQS